MTLEVLNDLLKRVVSGSDFCENIKFCDVDKNNGNQTERLMKNLILSRNVTKNYNSKITS